MEKIQCELCGGALTLSDDGVFAVCNFCGMQFKKERIQSMILTGPIQVEGIQNADYLASKAETFLELGEVSAAKETFMTLCEEYPADWRGWWGQARILDWARYIFDLGPEATPTPPLVLSRALKFAPSEEIEGINRYYEEQLQAHSAQIAEYYEKIAILKQGVSETRQVLDRAKQKQQAQQLEIEKKFAALEAFEQSTEHLLYRSKIRLPSWFYGIFLGAAVGAGVGWYLVIKNGDRYDSNRGLALGASIILGFSIFFWLKHVYFQNRKMEIENEGIRDQLHTYREEMIQMGETLERDTTELQELEAEMERQENSLKIAQSGPAIRKKEGKN